MNTKIFLSAKEWGEYFSQTVLTYPEQIRVLKRCGMIIHDWEEVESRLKHIGKTTLLPYLLYFWTPDKKGKYFKYVCWEDIYYLYTFDNELQELLIQAIRKIEISVREHIAYHMEINHGPQWYCDKKLFQISIKRISNHGRIIFKTAQSELFQFIKKYYKQNKIPTFREIMTNISFGILYRIYSGLKPSKAKEAIAKDLGVPAVCVFNSHLYIIEQLRNTCVHPQKPVWNKRFNNVAYTFIYAKNHIWLNNPYVDNKKIYYWLCYLNYLMQSIDPYFAFADKMRQLIHKYQGSISLKEMGFPEDWEQELMWCL